MILWGRNFIILHIFGWEIQGLARLKNSPSVTPLISGMRVLSVKHLNWVFNAMEQFTSDLGREGKKRHWWWGFLVIKWPRQPQWSYGHEGDWRTLSKWNSDILPEGTTEWIIFYPVSDLAESLDLVSSVFPSFVSFKQRALIRPSLFSGRGEPRTTVSWLLAPGTAQRVTSSVPKKAQVLCI